MDVDKNVFKSPPWRAGWCTGEAGGQAGERAAGLMDDKAATHVRMMACN